jgi:hypothetical protein
MDLNHVKLFEDDLIFLGAALLLAPKLTTPALQK